MNSILVGLAAAGMFTFGQWGRKCAHDLAPATLPPQVRQGRIRSLRRGGVAWQVGAVLVLAYAVLRFLSG